jgi:hypothetical protein
MGYYKIVEKIMKNDIKDPLMKAIFFTLIAVIIAIIDRTVIYVTKLDNNISIIIRTSFCIISTIICIVIIKLFHFRLNEIGIIKIIH